MKSIQIQAQIPNNYKYSHRMYIYILVLHDNTCFICAMAKLECLEQMIQLQRYVSEMDFFFTRMASM